MWLFSHNNHTAAALDLIPLLPSFLSLELRYKLHILDLVLLRTSSSNSNIWLEKAGGGVFRVAIKHQTGTWSPGEAYQIMIPPKALLLLLKTTWVDGGINFGCCVDKGCAFHCCSLIKGIGSIVVLNIAWAWLQALNFRSQVWSPVHFYSSVQLSNKTLPTLT